MIYTHDLDPILFQYGIIRIGWYGLMYALAFASGLIYLRRESNKPGALLDEVQTANLLTSLILGVLVGGRLGWVLFYGGVSFWQNPLRIFAVWQGGMSFHGGMLGVAVSIWCYARMQHLSWLRMMDLFMPWIPVGLGLGRIGNFINGELYGKPTNGQWGVIFPSDSLGVPRHPSQLYESFFEGFVLFLILRWLRKKNLPEGTLIPVFGLSYGLMRIGVEWVRLPDAHMGYLWGAVTAGQLLSLPMVVVGVGWLWWLYAKAQSERADNDQST